MPQTQVRDSEAQEQVPQQQDGFHVPLVRLEKGMHVNSSAAELPDSSGQLCHVQPAFGRAACLPWDRQEETMLAWPSASLLLIASEVEQDSSARDGQSRQGKMLFVFRLHACCCSMFTCAWPAWRVTLKAAVFLPAHPACDLVADCSTHPAWFCGIVASPSLPLVALVQTDCSCCCVQVLHGGCIPGLLRRQGSRQLSTEQGWRGRCNSNCWCPTWCMLCWNSRKCCQVMPAEQSVASEWSVNSLRRIVRGA